MQYSSSDWVLMGKKSSLGAEQLELSAEPKSPSKKKKRALASPHDSDAAAAAGKERLSHESARRN